MDEVRNPLKFTDNQDRMYYFECPWCASMVGVRQNEVNCKIFRCGIIKKTGKQIAPHTRKADCDLLAVRNLIWGCGKPFLFHYSGEGHYITQCGYI